MGMVKVQVGCFCKLNRKMMLLTPSVWDLDSKITDIGDSGSLRVWLRSRMAETLDGLLNLNDNWWKISKVKEELKNVKKTYGVANITYLSYLKHSA